MFHKKLSLTLRHVKFCLNLCSKRKCKTGHFFCLKKRENTFDQAVCTTQSLLALTMTVSLFCIVPPLLSTTEFTNHQRLICNYAKTFSCVLTRGRGRGIRLSTAGYRLIRLTTITELIQRILYVCRRLFITDESRNVQWTIYNTFWKSNAHRIELRACHAL